MEAGASRTKKDPVAPVTKTEGPGGENEAEEVGDGERPAACTCFFVVSSLFFHCNSLDTNLSSIPVTTDYDLQVAFERSWQE
ncbi:unnamed protein product [Ilex paraguariensis]|uniref:Uncharacterized protein n=1 Tax=Ilex paraguariensis TaxID=185542 RepID=A0ABC8V363_9AQUA